MYDPRPTQPLTEVLPPEVLERLRDRLDEALRFHLEQLDDDEATGDDIRMAARRRSEQAVEDIREALGRIEDGTYGTCEACRSPIPLERLEAVPHSSLCARCAASRG